MNLIKITTTPMKIAINVEKAKFEEAEQTTKPIDIPFSKSQKRVIKTQQKDISKQQMHMKQKDVYQPVETGPVKIGYMPLKLTSINGYRADLANDNMIMTHGGQEISSIKQERILDDSMPQVAYIPVTNTGEAKWEPNTLNLEFSSMQVDMDIEAMQKHFKYIPSRLVFEIEQYPSVKIEYIGDPLYVPPSANPNYEGEKE